RGCMVERLECGALDTEVAPSSGRWARLFETHRIYGEQRRVHPSRRRLRSYLSASEADPAVPPGGPRTPKIRNPSLRTGRPDTGGLPGTITAHTSRPCLRGRLLFKSEEHTSELQSRENLVCRLLLEKKKHKQNTADK